uniref:Wu:fc23c09 n=1 Tax=Fundulus heteroclitus TaxID=8078 RepID=A0A3Q2NVW6_FUNHE
MELLSLSNNRSGPESLPPGVLSPLRNLRTLNLDHNHRGVFNGMSGLLVLDLSANRLKNKGLPRDSFVNATHLESLNLEGNKLKRVPRTLPCSLKALNLEGNLISSIKKASFLNLNSLEHLGLGRNKIFKVHFPALEPVLHGSFSLPSKYKSCS